MDRGRVRRRAAPRSIPRQLWSAGPASRLRPRRHRRATRWPDGPCRWTCRPTTRSSSPCGATRRSITFQVKLVDASGDNVWWFNRPDFEFPREWTAGPDQEAPHRFRVGAHQGPHPAERGSHRVRGGGRSRRRARVGGRERARPARACRPEPPPAPPPTVSASSSSPGADPALAIDGSADDCVEERRRRRRRADPHGRFPPAPGVRRADRALARGRARLALRRRVLGRRRPLAHACVRSRGPRRLRRHLVAGGRDALSAPGPARRDRRGPTASPRSRSRTLAFGASPNAFFQALARESPARHVPAWDVRRAVDVDPRRHRRWRPRAGCCRRTARSRWRAADSRSSRSSSPTPGSSGGPTSRLVSSWSMAICRSPASPGARPQWELRVLGVRVRAPRPVSARGPLRAPEPHGSAATSRARSGGAAVPGEPPVAVPQHGRRHEPDSRHHLGRLCARRQHRTAGSSPCAGQIASGPFRSPPGRSRA